MRRVAKHTRRSRPLARFLALAKHRSSSDDDGRFATRDPKNDTARRSLIPIEYSIVVLRTSPLTFVLGFHDETCSSWQSLLDVSARGRDFFIKSPRGWAKARWTTSSEERTNKERKKNNRTVTAVPTFCNCP